MNDAELIYTYEQARRVATKLKLTLTTVESPIDGYKYFAIGPRRYGTLKLIQEQLQKHYSACTQSQCPIVTFTSLHAAMAFLIGFAVSSKQPIPFNI